MSKKFDEIEDTYCYYAMQSISVNHSGYFRPCCFTHLRTESKIDTKNLSAVFREKTESNIETLLNDKKLKKLRKDLLKGKKADPCKACWKLEEAGIKSFRQINNEIYDDQIDKNLDNLKNNGFLKKEAVTYLDITLGNTCNLKCRSCSPWASNQWIDESKTVPHTDWDHNTYKHAKEIHSDPWYIKAFDKDFFDPVLPNIKSINFVGGEPLVAKEHYAWLEHIIDQGWAKNIRLFYNTNGTVLPKSLLDIWNQFAGINLSLSLDAVGELAHYVRYPSNWKVIERNIEKIKKYSKTNENFTVHTHVTLSVLNIHAIDEMLDWCLRQYKDWHYHNKDYSRHYGYQNVLPHFNIVEHPDNMNIRHLPDEIKEQVKETLDTSYNKFLNLDCIPEWETHSLENIKNLKNILNQERNSEKWNHFIENTKASDKYRNIDIKEYIPWIREYL